MTTLKLWSEGKEMTECGVEIGGIQVTWAEIDLATDRKSAIDIGMTEDLCDDFEVDHKDYADLPYWLQDQAVGDDPTICEVCGSETKYPGQHACSSCLDAAYDQYCPR